ISTVRGEFEQFSGSVALDENNPENSTVEIQIDAASINTRVEDRDNHLKSADFFDVENHKELTFQSTKVEKVDDDEYKLTGLLTIKGVVKEVTLDVEHGGIMKDPWGNDKAGLSLEGKINRKDWGLNWNTTLEAGGVLVGDEVKISAEVQFAKQA
ncbi:MAG: YceI family protein, partial [Bacteroidales bacterium]